MGVIEEGQEVKPQQASGGRGATGPRPAASASRCLPLPWRRGRTCRDAQADGDPGRHSDTHTHPREGKDDLPFWLKGRFVLGGVRVPVGSLPLLFSFGALQHSFQPNWAYGVLSTCPDKAKKETIRQTARGGHVNLAAALKERSGHIPSGSAAL